MMCCIIAAFLFAQFCAMLRRWGLFWGVVRPTEHDRDVVTLASLARGWLARPAVRMAVMAMLAVELTGLGVWLYRDHGDHFAQLAGFSPAQAAISPGGERIAICTGDGELRTVTLAELRRDISG